MFAITFGTGLVCALLFRLLLDTCYILWKRCSPRLVRIVLAIKDLKRRSPTITLDLTATSESNSV